MTHENLVEHAVCWLRQSYRCGIVLSEQACCSGEVPDVIGWKRKCRSVVVECKVSRADFLADRMKPWRVNPAMALGCERFYLAPAGLLGGDEVPAGWGLLEWKGREVSMTVRPRRNADLRSPEGFMNEMNLLLASLARVELRIEPQTITDFLQWKNRMARYNGGGLPRGLSGERIGYLEAAGQP